MSDGIDLYVQPSREKEKISQFVTLRILISMCTNIIRMVVQSFNQLWYLSCSKLECAIPTNMFCSGVYAMQKPYA